MNKLIITGLALVVAFGTLGIGTTTLVQADPQVPHGTCQPAFSSGGAFGCAGDFGGFIVTPNGRCHTTGGPFNTFSC